MNPIHLPTSAWLFAWYWWVLILAGVDLLLLAWFIRDIAKEDDSDRERKPSNRAHRNGIGRP